MDRWMIEILTEFQLDNVWYEKFADRVHQLGKKWPDLLTTEEYDDATNYADSIVRRPLCERDESL